MRWTLAGASCFLIALIAAIFSHSASPLWWLTLGCAMSLGLFSALFSYLKFDEKVAIAKADLTIVQHLEAKLAEQQKLSAAQMEETGRKLLKTQEKFAAAQKLVAVHAAEVETLKKEKQLFSEEIVLKTRRIAELELFLEDPKSVPTGENEYVFLYEQTRKQLADLQRESTTLEEKLGQKIAKLEAELADHKKPAAPKKKVAVSKPRSRSR